MSKLIINICHIPELTAQNADAILKNQDVIQVNKTIISCFNQESTETVDYSVQMHIKK